jgi:hypothetical protein
MYAANRGGLRSALAGIQAGVLGALALLACVMVGSLWDHRSIWVVPNLFATTFFGDNAYRNQFLRTSWTGVALLLVVYGALGMIWGLVWRDKRKPWLSLYGAIAGIVVYFALYGYFWNHANPLVTLYAPDRQLEVGHVLWGIVLARSPKYARGIAESMRTPSTGAPIALLAGEPEVQEVRSGEVIR